MNNTCRLKTCLLSSKQKDAGASRDKSVWYNANGKHRDCHEQSWLSSVSTGKYVLMSQGFIGIKVDPPCPRVLHPWIQRADCAMSFFVGTWASTDSDICRVLEPISHRYREVAEYSMAEWTTRFFVCFCVCAFWNARVTMVIIRQRTTTFKVTNLFFLISSVKKFFEIQKHHMRSTLNNFLSIQYSLVNYKHIVVQQISRSWTFSSCMTNAVYHWAVTSPFLPSSSPWQSSFYFSAFMRLTTLDTLYKWIMQYWSFCDWLKTSLSIMSSSFVHVVAYDRIFFFFKTE